MEHLCNNKLIITGAKANPDATAMGVDIDSINVSDCVEFDALQTYDVVETMVKRLLEGIPLTCLVYIHELMQWSLKLTAHWWSGLSEWRLSLW